MRVQFSADFHVPPYVGGLTVCAVLMSEPRANVERMRRIAESERRDIHVGVRCTPAQREVLQAHAQARGQTVSTYLLSVALEETQTGGQSTD